MERGLADVLQDAVCYAETALHLGEQYAGAKRDHGAACAAVDLCVPAVLLGVVVAPASWCRAPLAHARYLDRTEYQAFQAEEAHALCLRWHMCLVSRARMPQNTTRAHTYVYIRRS